MIKSRSVVARAQRVKIQNDWIWFPANFWGWWSCSINIMMAVVVLWHYIFVKTHLIVHLILMNFIVFKLYLHKADPQKGLIHLDEFTNFSLTCVLWTLASGHITLPSFHNSCIVFQCMEPHNTRVNLVNLIVPFWWAFGMFPIFYFTNKVVIVNFIIYLCILECFYWMDS